jgi:hypothetical protein
MDFDFTRNSELDPILAEILYGTIDFLRRFKNASEDKEMTTD